MSDPNAPGTVPPPSAEPSADRPAPRPPCPPGRTVESLLLREAYRFDFYQVVNLIETLRPGTAGVGTGPLSSQEAARFVHLPSQAFPVSDVVSVRPPPHPGEPYEIHTSFLGLSGAHGPLPPPYTRLLLERMARKDAGMRDFLGIFEHRLIALMYQVRRRHRVAFDRTPPHRTAMARYLYSLIGLGTPGTRDRLTAPDRSLLQHAGILTHHPRSLASVCSLIGALFGVPVQGRKLIGGWQPVDSRDLTRLGRHGRNNVLGRTAMSGQRVWQQDARVRLILGPLGAVDFNRLLPGGSGFAALCELSLFCIGDPALELEVELRPQPAALQPARLSRIDGSRLGWTTRLATKPSAAPPAGILFGPQWTAGKAAGPGMAGPL